MMFVDANIFIKWMAAKKRLSITEAICGYILQKIVWGEKAITSSLVKDEVLIWLSRYRKPALEKFLMSIRMMPTLKIINPTLEDQENAVKMYGRYPLGLSDLINLSLIRRLRLEGIYTTDNGFKNTNIRVIFDELTKEENFSVFIKRLEKNGYRFRD
ncbi:MAG: type II toxin-antitoxin system VapC family toxin [Candidatus Njordarchaeum guaymaensis]|mgnify:CR=1 FL=1